jgi:hypothetical protein
MIRQWIAGFGNFYTFFPGRKVSIKIIAEACNLFVCFIAEGVFLRRSLNAGQ